MASIQLNNGSSISFNESTNYLSINNTAAEKIFSKHIGINIRNISINHIKPNNYLPSDDWDERWRYDYLSANYNNDINVCDKNYDITLYGDMISVLEKNINYENPIIIVDNWTDNEEEMSRRCGDGSLSSLPNDGTNWEASAYIFTGKTINWENMDPSRGFYLWERINCLEIKQNHYGYEAADDYTTYTYHFSDFIPKYIITGTIDYDTLYEQSYSYTGELITTLPNKSSNYFSIISYDNDGYYEYNDAIIINVFKTDSDHYVSGDTSNIIGPINGLIDLISDENQNIKTCDECMNIVSDTNIRLSEEMILQKTYPNSIILGFYIPELSSAISDSFTMQLWHTNLDSFISSVHIKYEGNNAQEINKSEFVVNSNNWHTITFQKNDLPKRFYIIITIPNIPDSFGSYTHNVNGTTRSPFVGNRFCYSVTFSDNFTQIPAYICSNMEYISFINIPNTVKYINLFAFQNCTSLKNVYLPDSVEVIDVGAFQNCTSLEHIRLSKNLVNINTIAFESCTSLKSVYMHNNVTHINSAAFQGCTSLEYIKFSDKITYINSAAFQGCTSLYKIELPCDLETIGDAAFSGCTSLYEIELPYNTTTLGSAAFNQCTNLQSVIISPSIRIIPNACFKNCNLNYIQIGAARTCKTLTPRDSNGKPYNYTGGYTETNNDLLFSDLTTIGDEAFYNAFKHGNNSKSVFVFPSKITNIGANAFTADSDISLNGFVFYGAKGPHETDEYVHIANNSFPNGSELIFKDLTIEEDYYYNVCGDQCEGYESTGWKFNNIANWRLS